MSCQQTVYFSNPDKTRELYNTIDELTKTVKKLSEDIVELKLQVSMCEYMLKEKK